MYMSNKVLKNVIMFVAEVLSAGILYVMMFFSAVFEIGLLFKHMIFWLFINVVLIFFVIQILKAIFKRTWISILVISILSFIWSVADYYTVMFHGSPLFPSEYANFKTAMDVISGYSFSVDADLIKLSCAFLVLVVIALGVRIIEKKKPEADKKQSAGKRLCSLLVGAFGVAAVFFVVIGPLDIKPKTTMGWSWKNGVRNYGILVCSIENMSNIVSDPFIKPEGYSDEAFSKEFEGKAQTSDVYPNIIVILNESFFDIEDYCEVNADVSPLESFYGIENAVYGYAPSSDGTNNAEYVLLTSNSLNLLTTTVPFNYLHMSDYHTSVVDYAKRLGYTTTAMHCGEKENYHRNTAYKDMGFDHVYLGAEDFKYNAANGNRKWLDSENYRDMLDKLSNDDAPQFMFLLTYQNHGGYDQNDASLDTVHCGVDYGNNTQILNEFMSSLKLSSDAFSELIKTLKDAGPTVVVMVGDHNPSFASELPSNSDFPGVRVPYVLWSNYYDMPKEYGGLASVEDLIPMVMESCGLYVSPYYEKLLEIRKAVPYRTKTGMYVDIEGNTETAFSKDSEYYELLNEYYFMEYNGLNDAKSLNETLFLP